MKAVKPAGATPKRTESLFGGFARLEVKHFFAIKGAGETEVDIPMSPVRAQL